MVKNKKNYDRKVDLINLGAEWIVKISGRGLSHVINENKGLIIHNGKYDDCYLIYRAYRNAGYKRGIVDEKI